MDHYEQFMCQLCAGRRNSNEAICFNLFCCALITALAVLVLCLIIANNGGVAGMFNNDDWDDAPVGEIMHPRPRPRRFVPHSILNISDYSPLMALYRREFAPQSGFIGIEIYYETLIALLDEPEVSVLDRFMADMSILEHRPIELYLLRASHIEGNKITITSVRSNGHDRYIMGIGGWSELRSNTSFQFIVPDNVVAFSTVENVSSFLADNGVEATVNERHLLIFDDMYGQFMPSHFLWVDTDAGIFFIWMANPRGPFYDLRPDHDFIYRLYTPEEFRANWQTLMCRETMDHNE